MVRVGVRKMCRFRVRVRVRVRTRAGDRVRVRAKVNRSARLPRFFSIFSFF